MSANQIMVVDDEVGIRELLFEILRDEGYGVRLAENAQTARNLRREMRPDLVLLDIWMPDTDGITLLKEWAGSEHPRIVVTSALAAEGITLSVRDNGAGIADAVLGRIFEPYVTTKPKGTGLGLAIVKKIVEEHHGQIMVENVLPHGAHVSIVLPLRKAA